MIYFDYAATTPMSDAALDVFVNTSKQFFGNTMSLHDVGSTAQDLLTHCRTEVAQALNCETEGIFFTSGGSESNLLAIYGLVQANRSRGDHILVAAGAHGSVKSTLESLSTQGFKVETVPPDEKGRVSVEQIKPFIKNETLMFITAHVNGEIGTIENLKEIGSFLHERGLLFHVDAVQSFGKLPIDIKEAQISSLSFSSHKIYGPKGVGGFYVNPRLLFEPLLPSISHEGGRRQGTVNVPGIAAFVEAMNQSMAQREENFQRVKDLKKELIEHLEARELPIVVESPLEDTTPYILALRVRGLEGQLVMLEANRRGLAISTGSACSVHQQKPSAILIFMGRSVDEAREVVRFSFGTMTTKAEVDQAVQVLEDIVKSVLKTHA